MSQDIDTRGPPADPTEPERSAAEPRIIINDRRFWKRDGDAAGGETPKKPSYVQELETKLAAQEAKAQDTLTQYKEARDEFEAAKARLHRDVGKEIESGKRAMLGDLLDVLDNLERAIVAAQTAGTAADDSLLVGVIMVRDQFLLKLQHLGVRPCDPVGKPFDPRHFEAVSMVPVSDATQDNVVVGVVRTAYLIGDDTLRPGMVAVGKLAAAG